MDINQVNYVVDTSHLVMLEKHIKCTLYIKKSINALNPEINC